MKIKTFVITAAAAGLLMVIPALIISMNTYTVQPAQEIQPDDVYVLMSQDPYAQAMKFDIVPVGQWKNGTRVFTGYAYVPSEETYKLAEAYAIEQDKTDEANEEGKLPLAYSVVWATKMLETQGFKVPEKIVSRGYYEIYTDGKFFFEE